MFFKKKNNKNFKANFKKKTDYKNKLELKQVSRSIFDCKENGIRTTVFEVYTCI